MSVPTTVLGRDAVQLAADRTDELGPAAGHEGDRDVSTAQLVQQLQHGEVDAAALAGAPAWVLGSPEELVDPGGELLRRTSPRRGPTSASAMRSRPRSPTPRPVARTGARRTPARRPDRAPRSARSRRASSRKKSSWTYVGRSHHSVPSLSKQASRSSSGHGHHLVEEPHHGFATAPGRHDGSSSASPTEPATVTPPRRQVGHSGTRGGSCRCRPSAGVGPPVGSAGSRSRRTGASRP